MPPVAPEDIAEILQAFGSSGFAHMELTVGAVRMAVDRAPTAGAGSVDLFLHAAQVAAPLLGFFQAAPEPGAPAFVEPGTKVRTDTTIGIIRVMQDQTVVKAGVPGTVVEVLVRDGEFVEYGQTLLRISTDTP